MTNGDRAKNQRVLREILEEVFVTETSDAWLATFRAAGVPCAPINDYAAALADAQVAAMGWVERIVLPGGAETNTFGCPVRFDGASPKIRRGPPGLGEHTSEIIAELKEDGRQERIAS